MAPSVSQLLHLWFNEEHRRDKKNVSARKTRGLL